MKKLIIISAMVLGGLGVKTANAQIGIRINLHLGGQPVYVPAPEPVEPVYDDYYYLPEVEAYYSVGEHCYYYQDGNRWISAAYLPGMYRNYDWRTSRRFEIHTNRPFMQHDVYRGKFGGYSNRADFYARAYPGRDRYDRGREQYGNRDWNQSNRGGYDRHDDRDRNNGYSQPEPNRNQGGYGQPNQGQNNGGYNQQNPGRNQGGYNQPSQGQNQGGYNQGGNQQQPSRGQGQQGGRGNGNNQPTNHGQDRGGNNGVEQHYAANKMGMIQDSREFAARPVRP